MDGGAMESVLGHWRIEGSTHAIGAWLFVRAIGAIAAIALASLAMQLPGLVGSRGVLPVRDRLPEVRGLRRLRAALVVPTLAWWIRSDRALVALAWTGAVAGVLAAIGIAPVPALLVVYVAYLSLFHACGELLSYQWDLLLIESTIVAILLSPLAPTTFAPTPVPTAALWLGWLLLFRLVFGSGFSKLASGDPTWRARTALRFHYETQPLPTPLAFWAHRLPPSAHHVATSATLVIETLVPFLVFGPAGAQALAAAAFVALMIAIEATGSFAFFNLNAIALSLLLIDDAIAAPLLPLPVRAAPVLGETAAAIVVAPLVVLAVCALARQVSQRPLPRPIGRALALAASWGLVAAYGLFSMMTTERPEIVIEGSDDGAHWYEIEPRWKPGDPRRAPRYVAPHQPRLDWQLWFAALRPVPSPWLLALLVRLLEGSHDVMRLFAPGPWRDRPPRAVRARLFTYRYADPETHRRTGAWWAREPMGELVPAITPRRDDRRGRDEELDATS